MSECRSYYLEQLEIPRWIKRTVIGTPILVGIESDSTQPISMWLASGEGRLLKNIMAGIGIPWDKVTVFFANTQLLESISLRDAVALFLFGSDITSWSLVLKQRGYNKPIHTFQSLTGILRNPSSKRSLYRELIFLKVPINEWCNL